MATGFNIAAISGYVEENSFELISKSILETDLASYMNVRVGLSADSHRIPIMDGDFVVQDGAACGFSADGQTTITQVPMEIKNNKINMTYCPQTLRDTFVSQSLAAGALAGEAVPVENLMADFFIKKLNNYNEKFIMTGDTGYSGLTQILVAANGSVSAFTASAWTVSTAVDDAQTLYSALPEASYTRDDLVLICSPAQYRILQLGITQENYYHIAPGGELYIPGTDVKVVASAGLSGSNKKYIGPASTLFLGTDLTSDFEQFKLWYSDDNDEIRTLMRWRLGVAVSEPNLWAYCG